MSKAEPKRAKRNIIPFYSALEEKLSSDDCILPTLLSFKEVCAYLGLGHTIVSKMIQTGELPSTRARNRIRVYAADIKRYLDQRKTGCNRMHEEDEYDDMG